MRVADSRRTPPQVNILRSALPDAKLYTDTFAPLAGAELIAVSPGVPLREPLIQAALARAIPVVSEMDLFAWGLRKLTPQAQVIAIPAPTTSHDDRPGRCPVSCRAGRKTAVAGDVGPAALERLDECDRP